MFAKTLAAGAAALVSYADAWATNYTPYMDPTFEYGWKNGNGERQGWSTNTQDVFFGLLDGGASQSQFATFQSRLWSWVSSVNETRWYDVFTLYITPYASPSIPRAI